MKRRDFIKTAGGILLFGTATSGWDWLRRVHSPTAELEARELVRRLMPSGKDGAAVRTGWPVRGTRYHILGQRKPEHRYGPAVLGPDYKALQ